MPSALGLGTTPCGQPDWSREIAGCAWRTERECAADGTPLQIWDCTGSANQQWNVAG
jgi:hypothetical protein